MCRIPSPRRNSEPGVPKLVLEEMQMDEIAAELEKAGYVCKRDDDLLTAGITLDFDPDDYPWLDEEDDDEMDES